MHIHNQAAAAAATMITATALPMVNEDPDEAVNRLLELGDVLRIVGIHFPDTTRLIAWEEAETAAYRFVDAYRKAEGADPAGGAARDPAARAAFTAYRVALMAATR